MTRTITFTNYYSSLSICCSGVVQKNNGKHDILTEKYNLFSKKKKKTTDVQQFPTSHFEIVGPLVL